MNFLTQNGHKKVPHKLFCIERREHRFLHEIGIIPYTPYLLSLAISRSELRLERLLRVINFIRYYLDGDK